MGRILKTILLAVLWLVFGSALTWLASTEDQRRGYLQAMGLAPAMERYDGRDFQVAGPGFEVRLAQPIAPPRPIVQPGSGRLAPRPCREAQDPGPNHHPEGVGSPCRAAGVLNPTRRSVGTVYRWTDANGGPVFSDHPPPGVDAIPVGPNAESGVGRFSIDYRFVGRRPEPEFERALAANIDGVFRFFATDLGLGDVEPLHVRLTVIEGERAFVRYRQEKAPRLATTSGFYTFKGNEAVVRWTDTARTLAVTRHEIAHLAVGNWLGELPVWLNEGLAEVAERLHFEGQLARTQETPREYGRLRELAASGTLPRLPDFLAMRRADWKRIGDRVAYPYAWSLIRYLLHEPVHQRLVAAHLRAAAAQRCRPFDHVAWLEAAYPGGIARLERDWRAWLGRGQPLALTF